MQTQLKNIRERKNRKTFRSCKKKTKMRLHHENLEKLYYITKVNFFCHFPTVKLSLYCKIDVFFEQFLVLYFNHSHLLQ